jgi:hypothetical protein
MHSKFYTVVACYERGDRVVRRHPLLIAFENAQRRVPADYRQNLRIVEALWEEGRQLGVLPDGPTLDGIEFDIRFARALNVYRPPRKDRSGPR